MNQLKAINNIFMLLVLLFAVACSSGGGDDGPIGTGLGPDEIGGTAAVGAPIANTEVVVKGVFGSKRRGDTDDQGKFKINIKTLLPPYLMRTKSADNRTLYSIAAADGVSNIHARHQRPDLQYSPGSPRCQRTANQDWSSTHQVAQCSRHR